MIYYAIDHYVTSGDKPMNSTVHGDDGVVVWVESDPQTDAPDHTYEQPETGWAWRTDQSGWQKHPDVLTEHASDSDNIERLSPWETTLTDGVTR
jgi:hypothetical protein